MELNFGKYLQTLMPSKRQRFSREDFLAEIYQPIIEHFNVVDRNGYEYMITRELTSNLFRNKANLPKVLQSAFSQADCNRNLFIDNFRKTLIKYLGKEKVLESIDAILPIIKNNQIFHSSIIKQIYSLYSNDDIYEIHWILFRFLGEKNNKDFRVSLRKPGRPGKNDSIKDFFYLSEEEKKKELSRMIQQFSKESAKITINQMKYFLSSLGYVEYKFNLKTLDSIIYNFLQIDFKEKKMNNAEILGMYFQNALLTYERKTNYLNWIKQIPIVAVAQECNKILNLIKEYKKTGVIDPLLEEMSNICDSKYYLRNELFKADFIKNNYFLIDFFGSIDHSIWCYCHLVAELAGKLGLQNRFKEYIDAMQRESKQTLTVIDRCSALIEKCCSTIPLSNN